MWKEKVSKWLESKTYYFHWIKFSFKIFTKTDLSEMEMGCP